MNVIKKINLFGWICVAAVVFSLIGMIIYIVSGTTGYMAGQPLDALPIVFTVISILALLAAVLLGDKLGGRITGLIIFVAVVLAAVSLCLFVVSRVELFSDVYFIPVNYPESEGAALNVSIVGLVFYVLSLICMVVAGFGEKLAKN